jgi:hypothetical protein
MPVFDPTLTAQKAAETIPADALNASGSPQGTKTEHPEFQTKGYIDARRTKRQSVDDGLGPELDIIVQQKRLPVHVFNVGPFPHIIPCGSAGTFYIPACPEDKPYIEMLTPLFAIQAEIYPKTRTNGPKRLHDDGRKMANEILGEGRGQDRRQSKRNVGVFVSASDEPTEKELKDARAHLNVYCQQQIAYMDQLWDRDRKLAYDVYNPKTFGAAARVLKLTGKQKPWLSQGEPLDNIECPGCMTSVKAAAPKCHNCGGIVNVQAYADWKARQAEIELDLATTPSKPVRKEN